MLAARLRRHGRADRAGLRRSWQESEQRSRRFVADASHELRTPLTALKGYIDVLGRGAGRDPATLDAALATMGREAERMRMLVLDLLTLARLDAQRPLERPAPSTSTRASRACSTRGCPGSRRWCERDLADPPVLADADREAVDDHRAQPLDQRLQATHRARRRRGSTARGGEHALLEVHDEGPGIAGSRPAPCVRALLPRREDAEPREGGQRTWACIVEGLARAMAER